MFFHLMNAVLQTVNKLKCVSGTTMASQWGKALNEHGQTVPSLALSLEMLKHVLPGVGSMVEHSATGHTAADATHAMQTGFQLKISEDCVDILIR